MDALPDPAAPDPLDADDDETRLSGPSLYRDAPGSVSFRKLRKRLLREIRDTIETHAMARPGARWLVGISGGKDSYTLLTLLCDLRWQGLLPVDLLACNLDQGQPGFPKHVLPEFLARHGIGHRIEYRDTYSVVKEKVPEGATTCALCSRLRRGNLYRVAREEGCEALVLGHHGDDAIETFFLNMLHGGKLSAMPPKLVNDEGDLFVLRPLIRSAEADIARFAQAMRFPIIPCDLCGSQEGLQRGMLKTFLADLDRRFPGRRATMLRALGDVRAGHLHDPSLFGFADLSLKTDDPS